MSDSNTREIITKAFIEQVESDGLNNVHVAKLIKKLYLNRNTFYYYFDNKYDVALYVFRTDLAELLTQNVLEKYLLYAPIDSKQNSPSVPYYTHIEVGARSLDFKDFYKVLVQCVLNKPAFYRSLFTKSQPEFSARIEDLYRPAVEQDLQMILGGRYLPRVAFEVFSDFYTKYIPRSAEYCLMHSHDAQDLLDDRIYPFWNMPYESLTYELQAHPTNRFTGPTL